MNGNIRDFGATGDGSTNDTSAVQQTIDAIAASGGGTVHCPPGVYRIGTIVLKSNVELHLTGGATLLASPDEADYTTAHNPPMDQGSVREKVSAAHLIFAREVNNIAITGRGKIDGNGRSFLRDTGETMLDVPGWRPGQLVMFFKCADITIRDVQFVDAPYWTIWPFGCQRVHVTGISILNNRRTPNGDGINPDCCSGVRISDCHIDAGDDCIAVRSDVHRLQDAKGVCENVTVTNCTLITCCCGIRLGFAGDGPIRNCTFNNLVMPNTRTGINILVPRTVHDWGAFKNEHGPIIENIAFSNIQMQTRIWLYLWTGNSAVRPAALRNVRLDNITATTVRGGYIGGSADVPIENIAIRGLDLTVHGEMDDALAEPPEDYPVFDDWTKRGIPHALFAREVHGLTLQDSAIRFGERSGTWRSALRGDRVRAADITGTTLSSAATEHPAIDLRGSEGVYLRVCRNAGPGAMVSADAACSDVQHLP